MTGDAGESTPASDSASVPVVREARPADADAVAAFARDTWGQRHDDYVPRVFPEWAASDDSDSGTFVATLSPAAVAESDAVAGRDDRDPGDTLVEGDGAGAAAPGEPEAVVGCIQGVLLTEWEAWGQGIRVDPAARGAGVGTALSEAALDWARDRGATVCRNMVFECDRQQNTAKQLSRWLHDSEVWETSQPWRFGRTVRNRNRNGKTPWRNLRNTTVSPTLSVSP